MKLVLLSIAICLLTRSAFAQAAPSGPSDQQGTITTSVVFTDASGTQWKQTRTDTWTLTYVQVSGTIPTVTPVPTPPTPPTPPVTPTPTPPVTPAAGITGVQTAAGQPAAQVSPGDTLVIVGTGFGAPAPNGNRVQIGGVVAVLKNWTNTAVTVVVPPMGSTTQPAFVQLYAQPANNWILVASGTGPVISPAPTITPVPSP